MRARLLVVLLIASVAFAAKSKSTLLSVTSNLADNDSSGAPFYVQSDQGGAYQDGIAGIVSDLNVNWYLDLSTSTRTVRVTFSDNAVQPGDPAYIAPANPPYTGTEYQNAKLQVDCFRLNLDMLTMQAGNSIQCPALVRLDETRLNYYRLDMGELKLQGDELETSLVNVQCNFVASDGSGCNDWTVDPIPVVNPDGSTTAGRAVARLVYNSQTRLANEGDFYLTFHYHITRP